MQFNTDTPRETYTIAGKEFNIPCPFAEGDELVLTEGTADRLNQDVAENVRNNLAKRENLTQEEVDAYVAGYEFGVRQGGGGGRTVDPIMREMLSFADEKVRAALKKAGRKLSGKDADISSKELNEYKRAYVEKHRAALEPLAQAAVAQMAQLPDAA